MPCDFCSVSVDSYIKHDTAGFNWLESVDPKSGADHLAVWCASCGPKHRMSQGQVIIDSSTKGKLMKVYVVIESCCMHFNGVYKDKAKADAIVEEMGIGYRVHEYYL